MNIEDDIFKRYKIDINKLVSFGFIKDNDIYTYTKVFMDNSFKAVITINNNKVLGKVIDIDSNTIYNNFRLNNNLSYANKVKEEYINILTFIRDKCFEKKYFIFDQTNRINDYIMNNYNCKPEFLWKKYSGYGVYRNKNNNKWFALIANIDKSSISNFTKEVEIINVKCSSNDINKLVDNKSYFKAYHMNKNNWITILLDDSLNDKDIIKMIDSSYEMVAS